jgi:hypothetical protein
LRKNSGFDFAFKGRGFSRAVGLATSMAAFSRWLHSVQSDFFRTHFSRAVKSLKMCCARGEPFAPSTTFSAACKAAYLAGSSGTAEAVPFQGSP